MQPRLMMIRMVANLMTAIRNGTKCAMIFVAVGILTNNEKSYGNAELVEQMQDPGDDDIEIRRKTLPACISVRFHVGPFIV